MAPSPSPTSDAPIFSLSYDHVAAICARLPADAVVALSATCRRFRLWALSDHAWEPLLRRDYPSLAAAAPRDSQWRRLYSAAARVGVVNGRRVSCKGGGSPRARASHSLNFVGGWLVLFGGGCEGGRHLDDTWVAYLGSGSKDEYGPVVSWQQVNCGIPSGRFGHSCTVVGCFLILFGGITDSGERLNDTWVGQVIPEPQIGTTISWRLLDVGPLAPPPRGAHAACSVGDRIVVIHGGIGFYGLRLGDTWLLHLSEDMQSGNWLQMVSTRPLPSPRSGHTLTCLKDSCMVLFGGRGSGYEVLNDVWLLDVGSFYPEWKELKYDASSTKGELPFPRVGHSASLVLGGKILVYGGEDSQRQKKDDFWVLDVPTLLIFQSGLKKVAKSIWRKLSVKGLCPNYRSFHGACTDHSGNSVYVFGGMVDGLTHPAQAYGLRFDGELYQLELYADFVALPCSSFSGV